MKQFLWTSLVLLGCVGSLPAAEPAQKVMERTNLALHCSVFSHAGTNPEYAVDGERNGNFHEAAISPENYLEVDLGSVRNVDGVRIFFWWGDSRYYRYYVTMSADGKKWTELLNGRNNTKVSSKEGYGGDFPMRKLRFIRLYVIHNSVNTSSHVREIEIYGK